MGFISEFSESLKALSLGTVRNNPSIRRQVLSKVQQDEEPHKKKPVGGGWARSMASDASVKRLLQALRSSAPGGWSDDRWEQSRHLVGIAYSVIHRTCEQMSQAEFQVFYEDDNHPDGKRPVNRNDPPQGGRLVQPYDLVELLQKPNHDDSFGDVMYILNQQMDLTGMALTWMVPNRFGVPHELYPIPTATAFPQPTINPEYPNGFYRIQPLYPYGPFSSYPTPNSAVGAPIAAEWMLRIKFPHPFLRYEGYSPLTALRLHLDEIEMIDRSRHYAMRRGINPSAVLQFDEMEGYEPLPEPEIERIKSEFENAIQGPENSGQLFIATPGAKLEPWGGNPKDMDYQEGWDQLVTFVMGGMGTPKSIVGMMNDMNYATLFATLKQFHLLTLQPKCSRISAQLTKHLAPFFGDRLIIEVRCSRIDDHDVKNTKLNILIQAKSITKGELRKEMDMPMWGDERDNEIAGEMPQPEQQPGGMPGAAPGMERPGIPEPPVDEEMGGIEELSPEGERTLDDIINQSKKQSEEALEPPEVLETRQQPGKLGRGSLNPRKELSVLRNGHRK